MIVTGEKDKAKIDMLLKPFLQGTFHGISRDTTVLTAEAMDEIYKAFNNHPEAISQFVER